MNASENEPRYKGNRRATNLVLNDELVALGKKYFPGTKHKSLSGFLESALRREFARSASRIRGAGHKVPEAVFTK